MIRLCQIPAIGRQKITAQHLRQFPIKKVFASPITRTQQTAGHIAKALAMEFEIDELLRERVNWGDNPQQSFNEFIEMWQKANADRDWVPPIGDSSRKAGNRLQQVIENYQAKNEHVVLVSHGGIIADFLFNVFEEAVLDRNLPEFVTAKDLTITECSVTTIDYHTRDKTFHLVSLASREHLESSEK